MIKEIVDAEIAKFTAVIDELESLGIVSEYSGSKARNVLVGYSYLKEIFDKSE